MSWATLAFLLFVIFCTAVLTGIFGLAGGLVLMGALALVLPVRAAFVTHGLVQIVANGSRAVLRRDEEDGGSLWLIDLERESLSRLASGSNTLDPGTWSPDGREIGGLAARVGIAVRVHADRAVGRARTGRPRRGRGRRVGDGLVGVVRWPGDHPPAQLQPVQLQARRRVAARRLDVRWPHPVAADEDDGAGPSGLARR